MTLISSGLIFTSSKIMDSKFIISCILETICLFHDKGLLTSVLLAEFRLNRNLILRQKGIRRERESSRRINKSVRDIKKH